ncbi:MAG: archaeal heat shock protein Hsp20 [Nitrososphaeraceae archaeon]
MSFWDRDIEDWFRNFFGGTGRIGLPALGRGGSFGDMPKQFDEMRKEMYRSFEDQFKEIESTAPKDLIKEYQTPEGTKVREVGPLVYGYSMTIGPDGKPKVREFGNMRPSYRMGGMSASAKPVISSEREPLADVTTTDKEIKVIIEMPSVSKENIKINAYDQSVEVKSEDPQRKYHRVIDIPPEADTETVKSTYKNGVLEISFQRKEQVKPKGKEVKIE